MIKLFLIQYLYSMSKKFNTCLINDNFSFCDAMSYIKENKDHTNVIINLDNIIDFIYMRTLSTKSGKNKTKIIKQLGTYNFIGLTKSQIVEYILKELKIYNKDIQIYTTCPIKNTENFHTFDEITKLVQMANPNKLNTTLIDTNTTLFISIHASKQIHHT